jgi:Ni/Co efflux regulator RcnB
VIRDAKGKVTAGKLLHFLALSLLQWTTLAAIAGFLLAIAAVATIIVTLRIAGTDRERDDNRRKEDRQWDSDRRKEDRDHDADLRRQDRECEDQLRREADEKWEQRQREERHQREDVDAQQQVIVEFPAGGPLSPRIQPAKRPAALDDYAGQWVALKDGRVIAHSPDARTVVREMRRMGRAAEGAVLQRASRPADALAVGLG